MASVALAGGECAKAAQFDPAAVRKLLGDRIENGAHDAFDLTLGEVGKVGAKLLHQF